MKKAKLAQLTKGWKGKITLVVVPPESYREACTSLLTGVLKASKANCIFVGTNISYSAGLKLLEANRVDPRRVFFIDTTSKSASLGQSRAENVVFIEDPKNLTMVGISISEALYKLEGKERMILIDSISSLLLYNEPEIVLRFMHSLIGRMRSGDVGGIVMILSKDYGDVLTRLASFVDEVVELA